MGRREDKLTRAAHIKRHTIGTSNEISFSVLDAAKNALDEDEGSSRRSFRPGIIHLFTLPSRRGKGVSTPQKDQGLPLPSGPSSSERPRFSAKSRLAKRKEERSRKEASRPKRSPHEEVAWRKARRRRHRFAAAAVIVLILGAFAGAGFLYLQQEEAKQQSNVFQLRQALDLIEETDGILMEVDALVSEPFDDEAAQRWSELRSVIPDTEKQLAEAEEKALAAANGLRESMDKEAANSAVATLAARTLMVERAAAVLDERDGARAAQAAIDEAWRYVLSGDALARQSAASASDTTEDNIARSKDEANEAIAEFTHAIDLFQSIESSYEDAELSAQMAYVEKRVEALGYAIASNDAFLVRDLDEAVRQNDAYNQADEDAASLAAELPDNPSQSILDALNDRTESALDDYSSARLRAASADAFLRDYLGTKDK